MKKKIIVVGAGPAGMIAAYFASNKDTEVIILEKNDRIGKKLRITGKGRCNITNACEIEDLIKNICVNSSFLYSAFYSFSNESALELFSSYGLSYKEERGMRVFPTSDKAIDLVNTFDKMLKDKGIKVRYKSEVKDILTNEANSICGIVLSNGEKLKCDSLILATGGKSYPKTGSNGDGYKLAKKLGHDIVEVKPALIGLETQEKIRKEQVSLILKNVSIDLYENNKKTYSDFGELEYRDYGIDGAIIKSASCHINKAEKCKIILNIKPALSRDKLDKRIQRDFEKYSKEKFKDSLKDLLHRKIIDSVIERSGIDPNKPVSQINKLERSRLVDAISAYEYKIKSFRKIDEAIVCSGGISVKDVDPHNMSSRKVENLYFAGEILDVHGYTGGFNLQIAYSTGYLAGISSINEK